MAEAGAFFEHPSQQKGAGVTPETLPADGFEYWACGDVCGIFHLAGWPGVWAGHYGIKPTRDRAKVRAEALDVLRAFWAARKPKRIIGWTPESNKLAVRFAKALGFEVDGVMPLPDDNIIITGWTP